MSKIIQMKNRVYADGYMEYWGDVFITNVPAGSGKSSENINFPYSFKNTKYDVQFCLKNGSAYWSNASSATNNISTSYMTLYAWNNGGHDIETLHYYYRVSGYIR